jgi:hypothetical protein
MNLNELQPHEVALIREALGIGELEYSNLHARLSSLAVAGGSSLAIVGGSDSHTSTFHKKAMEFAELKAKMDKQIAEDDRYKEWHKEALKWLISLNDHTLEEEVELMEAAIDSKALRTYFDQGYSAEEAADLLMKAAEMYPEIHLMLIPEDETKSKAFFLNRTLEAEDARVLVSKALPALVPPIPPKADVIDSNKVMGQKLRNIGIFGNGDISVRLYNCLKAYFTKGRETTIQEIANEGVTKIRRGARNFGEACQKELIEYFQKNNIQFKP